MKDKIGKIRIGLIFTLDYEIHGSGSGDFKKWVYTPTAQMLNIFDSFGVKLTIMAELGHYWAMKRYKHIFSTDISLFESQLKYAVERGHDVQLHFHPQWIDAEFKDECWNLDYSRKSIERLCHNYDEAYFYLKKGKEELQNLLTPINPNYQCICFRAGFFQMQPSHHMIKALDDAGFLIDSSVTKGSKVKDNLRFIDYTNTPSKYRPWKISKYEICKNDEAGKIFEFPILADSTNFISKLKNRIFNPNKEVINKDLNKLLNGLDKGTPINQLKAFSENVKSILSKSWYYADFCKNDFPKLIKYVKMVISSSRKNNDDNYIPVVLIGHSNDFTNMDSLSLLLNACQNIKEVEVTSYLKAIRKLLRADNFDNVISD